jgi:glycosyltransferase involved in cell wall biosynthesis
MVAYHYPPYQGSSGLQRTLAFSRDLPSSGWDPLILSANARAYPSVGRDLLDRVPAGLPVTRAFALDTARHLAVHRRYLPWLALPDRWVSWVLGAVPAGLVMIRRYRPSVIWSTYPIATAHLIGLVLHRLTGLPWVADFRDPMIEVDPRTGARHPADSGVWGARSWIERQTALHATRSVFVAPGALRICAERYSEVPPSRWALVANGYDEGTFREAEGRPRPPRSPGAPLVLLHSGVLYPTPDRDPTSFFRALSRLRKEGSISPAGLNIVLRASGHDDHYRALLREHGLVDLVRLEPPIPYVEALAEMLAADGLLVFQGYTSNPAIPAKVYEYLRARRPIFALVDAEGDTARTLRESGADAIAPIDAPEPIAAALVDFLERVRRGEAPIPAAESIRGLSRESRARELAAILDAVAECP